MNAMRTIKVEKLTVNFGAGKDQKKMERGIELIKMITGQEPVKTVTQERIPGWGLRPGLPVGLKLTLRADKATDLFKRLLEARENKLKESSVDNYGNISFGVPEYIDIPGAKYDPKIGIIGFEASVTLTRPGYRVQRRKLRQTKVGKRQRISKEEAKEFLAKEYNVEFTE